MHVGADIQCIYTCAVSGARDPRDRDGDILLSGGAPPRDVKADPLVRRAHARNNRVRFFLFLFFTPTVVRKKLKKKINPE